jgi:uncharacterized protein (TIGR03435 family)
MVRFSFVAMSLAGAALLSLSAQAQSSQDHRGKTEREVKFEVLSIRPVQPGSALVSQRFVPTPNGFASRLSIWQAIMIAYAPGDYLTWGTTQLLNTPNWIGDFYDFNARVSQADLKAWQNQSKEQELLRSALRTALKERFNLAIHERASTGKMYELVVGKGGPRLKAAASNSPLPVGAPLPSGGIGVGKQLADAKTVWDYHGATMQDLAWFLTTASRGIPVRDRTGLTGRYDFTFQQVDLSPEDEHVYGWPVDHLGLKVKSGTEGRPILIVDHIEKPTPN